MPKQRIIIALGVLVALMPFISIYRSWKDGLSFVVGIAIVAIASSLQKQGGQR